MNKISDLFFGILLGTQGIINIYLAFNTPWTGLFVDSLSFIMGILGIIFSLKLFHDALHAVGEQNG